jgi:hypothetical protein
MYSFNALFSLLRNPLPQCDIRTLAWCIIEQAVLQVTTRWLVLANRLQVITGISETTLSADSLSLRCNCALRNIPQMRNLLLEGLLKLVVRKFLAVPLRGLACKMECPVSEKLLSFLRQLTASVQELIKVITHSLGKEASLCSV